MIIMNASGNNVITPKIRLSTYIHQIQQQKVLPYSSGVLFESHKAHECYGS